MMRALIFCLLLPFSAAAQSWPSLHNVEGVNSNDALNVRAAPTTSSAVVGQLASDARDIEVVATSPDGDWGQINSGETSGWVALRFLGKAAPRNATQLPLACYGTEPFWSLEMGSNSTARFEALSDQTIRFTNMQTSASANNLAHRSFTASSPNASLGMTGFYRAASCNDGMSDRRFGIVVDFIVAPGTGSQKTLSGCCILSN